MLSAVCATASEPAKKNDCFAVFGGICKVSVDVYTLEKFTLVSKLRYRNKTLKCKHGITVAFLLILIFFVRRITAKVPMGKGKENSIPNDKGSHDENEDKKTS